MDPHLHRPPADASPSGTSKLQVVYYLSRSGHLEHPHLLEVTVLPSEGLRLRDVKKRLAMIRGKRLPCSFAWSYKRSYRNGYVWQDVCDDDLILPAQGSEYVLKGSEIVAESHAEKCPQYDTESSAPAGKLTVKSSSKQCGMTHNNKKDSVGDINLATQREISTQKRSDTQHSHITFEFTGNTTSLSNCSAKIAADGHLSEENPLLNTARTSSSSSDVGHHLRRHQPKLHSSSTSLATEGETVTTTSDEEVRSAWNPLPSPSSLVKAMNGNSSTVLHVTMVECGTDASTQTDEGSTPIMDCLDSKKTSSSVIPEGHQQKPTVLHKVEIISPPSSSSTTSPSTNSRYVSTDESHQGKNSATHQQYSNSWAKQPRTSIIEEKDELLMISSSVDPTPPLSSTEGSTPRKAGGLSVCCHDNHVLNQTLDTEPSSARRPPPRVKHLGAMSLLQFVSCGGLDVREQILPMSTIYNIKSTTSYASTPMSVHVPPSKLGSSGHVHQHNKVPSAEQLCEALGYNTAGQGKGSSGRSTMLQGLQSLPKGGGGGGDHANVSVNTNSCSVKLKSSSNVSQELSKGAASNFVSQSNNSCSSINHDGDTSKDVNSSTPRSLLAVPPDVISIGRSSISERSTNVSRELDYQTGHGSYNKHQHQHQHSMLMSVYNNNKGALSRGSPKLTLMEHINGGQEATADECKTLAGHQLPVGSPVRCNKNINQGTSRRAVSGEIFRGSPLFMPGPSTPNMRQQQLYQYHSHHDHSQQQHHHHHQNHNRAASTSFRLGTSVSSSSPALLSIAPIINVPLSNDTHSHHQACHNSEVHSSPTDINNTWAAAPNSTSCKEGMPPTRLVAGGEGGLFWRTATWDERTLQNAVDLSLPPLELLVLHECPHCSRKLKPELLKAHMKACNSPNFASSTTMKPPKAGESHGSLYQRFLKASPSPQLPAAASTATSPLK